MELASVLAGTLVPGTIVLADVLEHASSLLCHLSIITFHGAAATMYSRAYKCSHQNFTNNYPKN